MFARSSPGPSAHRFAKSVKKNQRRKINASSTDEDIAPFAKWRIGRRLQWPPTSRTSVPITWSKRPLSCGSTSGS